MPDRIYHWKHGWIPLDHAAALSKAKGHEGGARRYLAASHAAGHAHESVVQGAYGGGTHERGLQPVAANHLPRAGHITAAFSPATRRFGIQDSQGFNRHGDKATVTTSIPEHLAEHFHAKGYTIQRIFQHTDGNHKVIVRTPEGQRKIFNADGSDKGRVDPRVVEPPAPPPVLPPTPSAPSSAGGAHEATHTVVIRERPTGSGVRTYGVLRPVGGRGSIDTINGDLARHLVDNNHKVIGFQRRTVTTVAPDGVIRRFKADGTNLNKPTIVKAAPPPRAISGWEPLATHEGIPQTPGLPPISSYRAQGGVYQKGNKTVVLEANLTQAEKVAFLSHVDQALEATKQHTGHEITIHVPTGDRQFSGGRTLGYVYRGDSTRVHIAPAVAKGSATADLRSSSGGFHMAVDAKVHPTLYTLTHELGHIVDNKNNHTYGPVNRKPDGSWSAPFSAKSEARSLHTEQTRHGLLSRYGRTNEAEGYAEAFAHHHLGGRGTNQKHDQATDNYAEKYGWTPAQGWQSAPDAAVVESAQRGVSRAIIEARRRGLTYR